jgi:hypothetical protein
MAASLRGAGVVREPEAQSIFLLGAWLVSHPEYEETLRDMVRGVAVCDFKPNKGCVRSP